MPTLKLMKMCTSLYAMPTLNLKKIIMYKSMGHAYLEPDEDNVQIS